MTLWLLCLASIAPEVSDGATIRVPDDTPDIQRAIYMAKPGDTVLVAPGDYYVRRDLVIPAKGIVLRSESGPDRTRLINAGAFTMIELRGETEEEGEISGFTIIGGWEGISVNPLLGTLGFPNFRIAGNRLSRQYVGIKIKGPIGPIEENLVEGCEEGIRPASSASALLEGNIIQGCTEGIAVDGSAIISQNVIRDNEECGIDVFDPNGHVEITGNRISGNGHYGVHASFFAGADDQILIRENKITGNGSEERSYPAAGIYFRGWGGVITGNLIAENIGGFGAAIYYWGAYGLIEGNTIVGNVGTGSGAIHIRGVGMEVRRNIIAYNKATRGDGGGIGASYEFPLHSDASGPITLAWNTVVFNEAPVYGIGIYTAYPAVGTVDYSVHHCIAWGNRSPFAELDFCSDQSACYIPRYVRYCCLGRPRPEEGQGNFSADPLFVDAEAEDFRLLPGSPCIDAGDPEAERDPDGTRADIGAIPFDHGDPVFLRGDCTGDGILDLGDAISSLMYLFSDGRPACPKAADTNDDGALDMGDAIALLITLFAGGPEPEPPYPLPGTDPTPDGLPCGRSW